MKKFISIVFLFLALFFSFKEIVIFSISQSDSTSFIFDLSEEESEEKNEKSDSDAKDDIEDWQHNLSERLLAITPVTETEFQILKVKKHFSPYFEICSPPPETV